MNKNEEQYKVFKQVVNAFYHKDTDKTKEIGITAKNLTIEPKIIYETFNKTIRAEFKIGDGQLYKIKSLPEFFEKMLNHEEFKYGLKLEFVHRKEAFKEEVWPLLDFVLKYAEIIKYANETVGSYGKYMRTLSNEYITISNTGLDELFDVLKGQKVNFKRDYLDEVIEFKEYNPNIEFEISQEENGDYVIKPNIDVFAYEILQGTKHIYMLTKKALYRCDEKFKEETLRLLNIYRENYTDKIRLKREQFPSFCSIIYPRLKDEVSLKKIDEKLIQK